MNNLYENNYTTREGAEKSGLVNQLVNIYQTTGQPLPEKFVKNKTSAKHFSNQMAY